MANLMSVMKKKMQAKSQGGGKLKGPAGKRVKNAVSKANKKGRGIRGAVKSSGTTGKLAARIKSKGNGGIMKKFRQGNY